VITDESPRNPKGEPVIEPEFRVKPNYSQDWKAYDTAKTNEDELFKKLLSELLLLAIDEPMHKTTGRRGYSLRDKIFCMTVKVFYRSDLRKATSILKELRLMHYIDKVPCFKSIDNFFNDKQLSKQLDTLILITALPLAELETTGALDSTGFSTSRFERWFEYKWGKHEGKERVWRKAHACCGCTTNVFLSVEVTEKDVGDASMYEKVIGQKTKLFDMKTFVADKAYLSREILRFLEKLGLNPYIPFKSNSIGAPKGYHIWRKMFDEFKYNNERYMRIYHRRSNIETSFHMVKTNYGNSLLTKNYDANVNEIKIKFLCHNICVLIQEAFESDISIDFEECVRMRNSVYK